MGVFLDNSIKNVVGVLNVRYFFAQHSARACPSNEGASVLVGAFKSFKQKFYFPKPIKTHFFNQLIF